MKKSIYIVGIALGLLSSACSDWLTVEPKTSVVAENLFTTDEGVSEALNGAYVLMRSGLYSPEGVMGGTGMVECLAATWTQSGNVDYDLSAHVYNVNNEDMGNKLDNAFSKLYTIIANVNPLIDGMVENKAKLDSNVYNIVRGEALAIRALCHLDLIRLWGPMPTKVEAGKAYLPYVTVNSTSKYTYIAYEEYMTKLFADLNEAELLLRRSDPILTNTADNSTGDSKWLNRQKRINYYGVLGLQARARMWYGEKDDAVRYAKLVKEAVNTDGTPKFKLADNDLFASFGEGQWDGLFYPEHLCGVHAELYNYELGAFNSSVKVSIMYKGYDFMALFDNNTADLRYDKVWYTWAQRPMPPSAYCIKYQGVSPKTSGPKNMPIVRLAEMYLTIMEAGTLAEANAAYQEFCTARNITYVPYTEADRQERVLWEYIREFMAEGQNFFTYKRNGVKRMFNQPEESLDCDIDQYVLPLPPKEF